MTIATNLAQALNLFDPREPLSGPKLRDYYVDRPGSPLKQMEVYLRGIDRPTKVLFTGHRGSGKSTELFRLVSLLDKEFFIVRFSVVDVLNPFDLTYVDLLLALATSLFRYATDAKLLKRRKHGLVRDDLLEDVYRWFTREVIEERAFEPRAEAGVAANVNLLAVKLEGKLSTEASTRRTVRQKVEPRLSELLEKVNYVLDEVRRRSRKRVLIIVEDVDKLDLPQARALFLEHAIPLTEPKAHIIYTFPVALRHLNDLPQIRNNFGQRFVFPNVKIFERDGSPCQAGRQTMTQVVSRRMASDLITEQALEEVVTASGGVMLTLVQLVQSAATYALSQGREAIDEESVHKVIADVRNDYQALLTQQHYATLRRRRQDKSLVNEEEVRDLLHNLSLLEYRNDQVWCDVNPIVAPLLEGESSA